MCGIPFLMEFPFSMAEAVTEAAGVAGTVVMQWAGVGMPPNAVAALAGYQGDGRGQFWPLRMRNLS